MRLSGATGEKRVRSAGPLASVLIFRRRDRQRVERPFRLGQRAASWADLRSSPIR